MATFFVRATSRATPSSPVREVQDSIEAHLTIVFTALAVARDLQNRTGVSIRRIVHELKPLRDVTINALGHNLTAITPPGFGEEQARSRGYFAVSLYVYPNVLDAPRSLERAPRDLEVATAIQKANEERFVITRPGNGTPAKWLLSKIPRARISRQGKQI